MPSLRDYPFPILYGLSNHLKIFFIFPPQPEFVVNKYRFLTKLHWLRLLKEFVIAIDLKTCGLRSPQLAGCVPNAPFFEKLLAAGHSPKF
jgi:hypothetical protein